MNLQFDDINVQITWKHIKWIRLGVYPPMGCVKIFVPKKITIKNIQLFIISKLGWIKAQQNKIRSQQHEVAKEYVDDESHYFNGTLYLLKIIERQAAPEVILSHSKILIYVRPGADKEKKQAVLDDWYRQQLKEKVSALITPWQKKMNVLVTAFTIRKMKTKWGSCSPMSRSIRLNLALVKKPPECLEYVLVHELTHLLEPSHNKRFVSLMDQFLPTWRFCREKLNSLSTRDGH
ncbi:MAG: metal-dependent hydrolase [Gammaproteobacteria bacterium CG_4_10_14_0_8_um_filter_38_16]|nr:MAG: metal-dependent hydrolase [Gammaproteobacteria bacterium CG_4_10_14_0_8_um_filter_38_16]PJA03113.1 MAG: metal-dependent hydrolase [Gammaproteobacteria bacterium CG_4_10_14_0_2_um_filter_38_22]PJB10299.1 MAG: metal-dependent hydrolase [Gammaproteobacteria bacterium CG_4_9_14_3_um_filter_38_9]